MKIKILDPLVANQIAAGEVIERPASIVKECLENSLDAGATQLDIDIAQGGMQLIRIVDNGHGIAKEDLPNAVKRHGTSKISTTADLNSIASLGFRGEALASICAVARVSIASAVADEPHGWQLIAEGTEFNLLEKPVAHPVGTSIIVRDLFFNTPARRRFVKTEKTEILHIEEVVSRIALSRFNTALKLTHNQRQIFQLPVANTDLLQDKRISQLCGKEFIDAALKIDMKATDLRLWGWLAEPTFYRSQADKQYLFINGRMVRDKLLNHAIRQAYQPLLEHNAFPAYVLYLECDPTNVDVNAHPTKHEVRFHQSRLIHDFVLVSVKKALETETKTPVIHSIPTVEHYINNYSQTYAIESTLAIAENTASYATVLQDENTKITINLGEPLTVISEKFLITKNPNSLGILNLSQAHVILFNKILARDKISAKPLLFPLTINFSAQTLKNFAKNFLLLNTLGFSFEILGETQLTLRQTPTIMDKVDFVLFCNELANKLDKQNNKENLINKVAYVAAMSIKNFETKAAQEKLLQTLTQYCTAADLKSCYQIINETHLARMFNNV